MIKRVIKEHSLNVITKSPLFYRDAADSLLRYPHRTVMFIKDNNNREFSFWVKVESGPTLGVDHVNFADFGRIPIKYNWTPVQVTIVETLTLSEPDMIEACQFLKDWMMSDNKYDVTLERLDPTGVTVMKWLLQDSFIQETHHELVFDRTVGDITIRLNYNHALLT